MSEDTRWAHLLAATAGDLALSPALGIVDIDRLDQLDVLGLLRRAFGAAIKLDSEHCPP
jgi:hypothetical protein